MGYQLTVAVALALEFLGSSYRLLDEAKTRAHAVGSLLGAATWTFIVVYCLHEGGFW